MAFLLSLFGIGSNVSVSKKTADIVTQNFLNQLVESVS